LSKVLLRQGRRAPQGATAWSQKYLQWVQSQSFEQAAQQATLIDYLHEVQHAAERIVRLERCIDTAIEALPAKIRSVIEALQSLRGVAKVSAVSIMAELGEVSRFAHARQLMGYSGLVSREHSSGQRIRRGAISKAGSAHLRRIVVEAAWAYRHRPGLGATLLARQRDQGEDIKAMAWKAQHRLHARYTKLLAKGKPKQQVMTAVARELLGFIWAIGVTAERSQPASPHQVMQRAA
jgi:transposase